VAKRKITKLVEGWSRDLRASYVYAVLECGHSAAVPLLPERYACMDCGHVRERTGPLLSPYCPECGCGAAKPVFRPDPHNAEHRLAAVGDKAECKDCDHYAAALQELRNLDRRGLVHSRYREWCGKGIFYVYRRDPKSPSGVVLAHSIEATREAEDILRSMKLAPLSPTEGLRGAP
jgi:predicted  nucleic acid-binding Zn-ribbon protein